MKYWHKFSAKIRPEEWLAALVAVVAVWLNVAVYHQQVSLPEALIAMVQFFTFGEPFYGLFFIAIYGLALFDFYQALALVVNQWLWHHQPPTKAAGRDLLKKLFKPIRVILPIAITALPMYQLLAHFSYQWRLSSQDIILAKADQQFIGGLLFIYLPTKFVALWLTKLLRWACLSLSIILCAMLTLLFLLKQERLLRLMIAAVVWSFILAYPFFYYLPCQDPYHAFIENNRRQTIPSAIQTELAGYHPSAVTQNLAKQIAIAETNTEHDNTVPVSCLPSMHAVWALIVIYFLARLSRWTIGPSLLWLVVMLAGGLYFAQHYLVDYVVAIPIAMLSIGLAYWLLRGDKKKN